MSSTSSKSTLETYQGTVIYQGWSENQCLKYSLMWIKETSLITSSC